MTKKTRFNKKNIYISLFVYISPEKPQWGVANYIYIFTFYTFIAQMFL